MSTRPDYLPIGEHGLIGDLHTAALVGTDGRIDWFCCPRFDSPSMFGSILDHRKGGEWRLEPDRDDWNSRQLYVPGTNVLLTRFYSPDGVIEVEDFMPIGGLRGRRSLCRRVMCVRGHMRVRTEVTPRFDYGRCHPEVRRVEGGAVFEGPAMSAALTTPIDLAVIDGGVSAHFEMHEGDRVTFVLSGFDDGAEPATHTEDETEAAFEATIAYWRKWLSQSNYRGRWREMVDRSVLTLKLLTYAPTGAIVAAPTTSLPEEIGGGRNWDYRATWIRDAAFTLYALLRLGFSEEAAAFMEWLTGRFRGCPTDDGQPLRIMYRIDGGTDLTEEVLDHLEGYKGSAPVRVGNGAADQLQLDIYGELVDSIYLYNKYGTALFARDWEDLSWMVDWLCESWDQPDEGIWEVRGGKQHFTYSRLMSWVAIERAIRVARQRGLPADIVRWSAQRDAIYRQIMSDGWSEKRQAFAQSLGSDTLDASVLLMPLVKFISPTDPRWLSTLDAIRENLATDALVYRYDPSISPDGLHGGEGTFSMCSFWYIEATARAGRVDEARLLFERMLTYANHLGLYSEEIGITGEQLGNFPQAFTHLALISAAYNLDRSLG